MRTFRVVKNGTRKVSATLRSPDDISAATPTIALHDDTGAADSFLTAAWTTTPALDTSPTSPTYNLWVGVAETTAVVDFSAKALGTYIVRGRAGTSPPVDCYILKVIP